jgi:GNAT superfamily N-acetyltransferase
VKPSRGASLYRVEPLTKRHERSRFTCGRESLDRYIRQQARGERDRDVAATFVAVHRDDATRTVCAYYSLAMTSIDVGDLPPELSTKLPRYPVMPAALLGRLAVDTRHQGRGLGELVLADALARCLAGSREIAAVAVIVDALDDEAVAFYEHFQFIRFPDRTGRLFLPMKSVAKLFAGV